MSTLSIIRDESNQTNYRERSSQAQIFEFPIKL